MHTEHMQETAHHQEVAYTVETFARDLLEQGVSALEIVWGNHKEYFEEIPPHCMGRYLRYRRTLLHRKALSVVLLEESMMESHPFAS